MTPLKLKLQGFIGILKGLGKELLELDLSNIPKNKQLVAFVGLNGNGKTTILDNLHPYRVMPSHSTTLGPGGFSYWDHVTGLTAEKELEWEHGQYRYRSSFIFKTKSQKAEYYLHLWDQATGQWTAYVSPDGLKSDSKATTYDKCIESILGSPERFFTSQFSAQHRKALASYGATDVKALLASILNHQLFGELGTKAAQVAKLLRFQLEALQDDLARARATDSGIEEAKQDLASFEARRQRLVQAVEVAEQSATLSRTKLVALEAKRASQSKDVEQALFLRQQIDNVNASAIATKERLKNQHQIDIGRLQADSTRLTGEISTARVSRERVDSESKRLRLVISEKEKIEQAATEIPQLRSRINQADALAASHQAKLQELAPVRARLMSLNQKLANIQAAGEGKKLMLVNSTETAALIDEVPCKGMAIQSQCKLLSNANAAKARIPSDTREYQELKISYRAVNTEAQELQAKLAVEPAITKAIDEASALRSSLQSQLDQLQPLAARNEMLEVAAIQLPQREAESQRLKVLMESSEQAIAGINATMTRLRTEIQSQQAETDAQLSKEVSTLTQRLDALEQPVSLEEIHALRNQLTIAEHNVAQSKDDLNVHHELKANLLAKIEVLNTMKEKTKETLAQASRLQDEIADWKLMEKGMDGLIALSIDDAGPEISQICNELLADQPDSRFTVRLDTQREMTTGNLKETFDIMVFSDRGGDGTPIGLMSGGEKIWVDQCLTRAIALHVNETNSMGYKTLFTDETDGAFDPLRKRNFMQMKRKVLQRGNYEREYFISHTPELWELADHIIYMDSL